MDAFLRGHAAGQAEREHAQQLETNKLHMVVLKHQIAELKIDDQLRANDLKRKFADLALGQDASPDVSSTADSGAVPAAPQAGASDAGPFASGYRQPPIGLGASPPQSLVAGVTARLRQALAGGQDPSTSAGSGGTAAQAGPPVGPFAPAYRFPQTGAEPPTSLADGVLARLRRPSDSTPSALDGASASRGSVGRQVVSADPNMPTLMLHTDEPIPDGYEDAGAPGRVTARGTADHPAMKNGGHVWLDAIRIPELNIDIPGMWFSAKAAREEEMRRAVALKRAEQPLHNVGPEQTVLQTNVATGRAEPVYTNPARRRNTSEFGQFQQAYAEDLGATSFDELTPQQKLGAMPAYTKARQDPDVQAQLAEGRALNTTYRNFLMDQGRTAAEDRRTAAEDRADQTTFQNEHRLYEDDVRRAQHKHTEAMKAWSADFVNLVKPAEVPGQAAPEGGWRRPAPEYDGPASFEDWSAGRSASDAPRAATSTARRGTNRTTSKTVTAAELQQIATRRGTTVAAERARAIAAGYAVVR